MTLPYSPSIATFMGNGLVKDFPFSFKVWDSSQLMVTMSGPSGMVESIPFSAQLSENGGTVTALYNNAPVPQGHTLSIVRNMPFEQGVDLVSGTRFDPQVIEDQMDKAAAERQQLREELRRAVKIPSTSTQTQQELLEGIYQARDTAISQATVAIANAAIAVDSATTALLSEQAAAQSADAAAESSRIAQDALEHGAPVATDTNKGVVYLSDAIDAASDSSGATATTPLAVRKAIDAAVDTAANMDLDMGWKDGSTYRSPCARLGSNGRLYLWRAASGPAVTGVGAKDPAEPENGAYWVDYAANTGQVLRSFFDTHSGKVYYPGYAGQFHDFQLSAPPVGWMVCTGGWLDSADVSYQELWRNLNHPAFATLVVTDAQWTGKSTAAGGVGGVPFFVVDAAAKRIRLPDTRGDYTRAAGSSYLEAVGGWHDSENKAHRHSVTAAAYADGSGSGWAKASAVGSSTGYQGGTEARTRTYGTLGCVCVGPTQTQPSIA